MRFEPHSVEQFGGRTVAVVYDRHKHESVRCYRRRSRIVRFSDDGPVPKGVAAAAKKLLGQERIAA